MWLQWDQAAVAATCLAVLGFALRATPRRWLSGAGAVARETAMILGLYAVWQRAGDYAVTHVTGATANARSLWRWEQHLLHLPSEVAVQRAVLGHAWLVQALNLFYAGVHVPALIVFLIWLFVRHRDAYGRWRTVGAVMTGACLVIQMIPVAPPRMLPELGFVDTALQYHQSVYGPSGIAVAPQLAAMPSVHVAWAVFIAVVVLRTSTSRWRGLVVLHPVLTVWAVVATANHWWLDGIVAVGLLTLAYLVVEAVSSAIARARDLRGARMPAETVIDLCDGAIPAAATDESTLARSTSGPGALG
jgi:hypothetical protein